MQINPQGFVDFNLHLGARPFHDGDRDLKIDIQGVNFWYGEKHALKDVSLKIHHREVTAFIGPSGCGKSTMLRCLNRSNDIVPGARMTGTILLDGADIYDAQLDPPLVRRRFGWVAQKPNPFPFSIYDNVAYAPRIHGLVRSRAETDVLVETGVDPVSWTPLKSFSGVSHAPFPSRLPAGVPATDGRVGPIGPNA